jgi:hypothetical protein
MRLVASSACRAWVIASATFVVEIRCGSNPRVRCTAQEPDDVGGVVRDVVGYAVAQAVVDQRRMRNGG